jgi:hypothetical protein
MSELLSVLTPADNNSDKIKVNYQDWASGATEPSAWRMAGMLKRFRVLIHTQNPVGKENIKAALRNAHKAWMEKEFNDL